MTLFVRQIPNITDPFVGRLFSGGSQSSSEFIVQDFAVIMIVAAIMLIITYKLKQSMVIGYILAGIVITLAILALFDSATNTPAKNAPVATERPSSLAANDKPNANPRITIRSNA